MFVSAGNFAVIYPDDEESPVCSNCSEKETWVCFTLYKFLVLDEVREVFSPHSGCLF